MKLGNTTARQDLALDDAASREGFAKILNIVLDLDTRLTTALREIERLNAYASELEAVLQEESA